MTNGKNAKNATVTAVWMIFHTSNVSWLMLLRDREMNSDYQKTQLGSIKGNCINTRQSYAGTIAVWRN